MGAHCPFTFTSLKSHLLCTPHCCPPNSPFRPILLSTLSLSPSLPPSSSLYHINRQIPGMCGIAGISSATLYLPNNANIQHTNISNINIHVK